MSDKFTYRKYFNSLVMNKLYLFRIAFCVLVAAAWASSASVFAQDNVTLETVANGVVTNHAIQGSRTETNPKLVVTPETDLFILTVAYPNEMLTNNPLSPSLTFVKVETGQNDLDITSDITTTINTGDRTQHRAFVLLNKDTLTYKHGWANEYTYRWIYRIDKASKLTRASVAFLIGSAPKDPSGSGGTGSELPISGKAIFDIFMDQVACTITPEPGKININNTSITFSIEYAENMVITGGNDNPVFTFDPPLPGTPAPTIIWGDATHVTYTYTVTNDGLDARYYAYTLQGGIASRGGGSVTGATRTGTLVIDFKQPVVSSITFPQGNVINSKTEKFAIQVEYNEKMDTLVIPNLEFAPQLTVGTLALDATPRRRWSADGKTYTAYYDVDIVDENNPEEANVVVTVKNGKDFAGNGQVTTNNTAGFPIDQRSTRVSQVTMTPGIIHKLSGNTAELTITFQMAMNTSLQPTIEFVTNNPTGQNVGKYLTNPVGRWEDHLTYKILYTVAAQDGEKIDNKIDVTVKKDNCKNTLGDVMENDFTTIGGVFTIDFNTPVCIITFSPDTIRMDDYPFPSDITFTLTYNEKMNQTHEPSLDFGTFATVTNQLFGSAPPSKTWVNDSIYSITYSITTQTMQTEIRMTANGGVSTGGSPQVVAGSAQKDLVVDLLPFTVTATPSATNVTCAEDSMKVTVTFNQPMKVAKTDANIISFSTPVEPFLTLRRVNWRDSRDYAEIVYDVDGSKGLNGSIDINVLPMKNKYNREYPGETFPNKFSASATPPVIDGTDAKAPTCHDDINGHIHFTLSGGTPVGAGFNYLLADSVRTLTEGTGNDYTLSVNTATSAEINELKGGLYRVKIVGNDLCYAFKEFSLPNPEAVRLSAAVTHHWEKTDKGGQHDGEITAKANGGVTPYNYYIEKDGRSLQNQRDTIFAYLSGGKYTLRAEDDNGCTSADTSLTVQDYRTPTLFSPNGDMRNEVFMEEIFTANPDGKSRLDIFDRTGTLVYSSTERGWDGSYKGKTARPAIYFYVVTFPDGYVKKGTIQLYKK
jgi:gliding motility-associated-like protein